MATTLEWGSRKTCWERSAKQRLTLAPIWSRFQGKYQVFILHGFEGHGIWSVRNTSYRYFNARGKMASKVTKYPDLVGIQFKFSSLKKLLWRLCNFVQDDYKRGIREYDEKVYFSFKLILQEIRNIYVRESDQAQNFCSLVIPVRISSSYNAKFVCWAMVKSL